MAKPKKGQPPLGLLLIPYLSVAHFSYKPFLEPVLHSKLLVMMVINPDNVESCYNFFHLLFSSIHALRALKASFLSPGAKKWKCVCAHLWASTCSIMEGELQTRSKSFGSITENEFWRLPSSVAFPVLHQWKLYVWSSPRFLKFYLIIKSETIYW